MKLLLATLLAAMAAAAPAAASSFVLLQKARTQPSPSIIMFVEPAETRPTASAADVPGATPLVYPAAAPSFATLPQAQVYQRVSASIIAMGEPAVEPTIVASIAQDEKRPRNPHLPPMVIRGGLSGDAFVRGNGLAAVPAATASAVAAAPGQGNAPAPGQQRQPEQPKAPPPPQPQAPAAPTRLPE
ncbi:MAG: hypothetical protein KF849_01000 [Rhizobiaceae bacterium]|nr:hypothetical protein [Rhizobiaceae bacterium]